MIEFFESFIVSVIIGLFLFLLSYSRPPEWENKLSNKTPWKKIQVLSFVFSLVMVSITAPSLYGAPFFMRCTVNIAMLLLSYMFFQSLITDPQLRLVDRKSFFIANTLALLNAGVYLYFSHNHLMAILTLVCGIVAFAMLLVPQFIGQSDGRAFLLVVLAGLPFLGLNEFIHSLEIMIGLFVLYSVYKIFFTKEKITFRERFGKIFVTKISLPAVPMILAPSLMFLLYYSFSTYVEHYL